MAGPLPEHSNPTTGQGFLTLFFGSNRRRKLTYSIIIAFGLTLILFSREVYISADLLPSPSTPLIPLHGGNTTTISLYNDIPSSLTPIEHEPVAFTLIMWSEASAIEGALLLKSILMYNSRPSDIHIICDDQAEEIIRSRISLVRHPSHHVRVFFYKPTWQSMLDRVEREGSIQTDHSAGLPGLMKLFIHEIIPSTVKKSVYIDTDAFFISDPALLWDVFDTLRPSTAIVMASHPDQDAPEWHHASRICSCVMLLDLEKLRSMRLMDSSIYREIDDIPSLSSDAFKTKYGLPGGDGKGRYDNVRLGDQGYWWAIVDYRSDIFEPLSYDFEVTSCLMDTYLTGLGNDMITMEEELSHQIHLKDTPQQGKTVLPKLLHFNCLHGSPIYFEWSGWSDPSNGLTQRWGPAISYHRGFKWIWLNGGQKTNPNQVVDIFNSSRVIFADEIASRQHTEIHMSS